MSSFADLITDRLRPALAALLTAFDYAADSGLDRWEFAIEMSELLREPSGTVPFCSALGAKRDCPLLCGRFSDRRSAVGATVADVRWLVRRGLAEHAKETTIPGDPARTFRPLAPTSFPDDACLTLTLLGAAKLRPFVNGGRGLSPFAESAQQKGTVPLSAASDVDSQPENADFAPSLATGSEDLESCTQQSDAPLAGSLASRSADGDEVMARRAPSECDHAACTPQNGDPATAQRVVNDAANDSPTPSSPSTSSGQAQPRPKPRWYPDFHELHFNGSVIKRFRLPARNQELILAAFEEEGWPPRIDDPLPPTGDLDPRQRLRNTIVTLNRHQLAPLLHFRCDGTGRGVQWEQRR